MSEQSMVELAQQAFDHLGIGDTVLAVGQFQPRGESGAMFAGGMIGDEIGGAAGQLASGIGLGAGVIGGAAAQAAASGLPRMLLVAVSETKVYGLHTRSRRQEPDAILFTLPRDGLVANVHQRVNVRVLELIHDETGVKVELEGNRLPITHSKDIMEILRTPPG
jgi:hypothetical protein